MSEKLPNIIFVFSDQHRFCDVGYAGNTEVKTPNLDKLAVKSAVFRYTYSNCPVCVPARGTILTGLHALQHGAAANDLPIRPDCVSIADVLRHRGYETAYIGKWHLGGAPRDQFITHYNRLGFEYWRANNCNHQYFAGYYDTNDNIRYPIEGYAPVGETDLALEFMERRQDRALAEKPFALFLGYGAPHDPYLQLPEDAKAKALASHPTYRGNVKEPPLKGETSIETYNLEKFYAGYYEHIHQIDIQVGRVVEYLEQAHLFENTIFVYTSDHGDMLGSHGYLNKQMYFDESTRVPFLISWPGHIPAGERTQLLSLVNLAPTLAGLVGGTFENEIDGKDLSKVVLNPAEKGQDHVYMYSYVPCHQAKNRTLPSWRAVSDGEYLLVADQDGKTVCMYHTEEDPLQMEDISERPEYASQKEELRQKLDREVAKTDSYEKWEELLKDHHLDDLWKESETFFSRLFKH